MTTPKEDKPVYTNQPNYMFPDLQGLPEEFRRLAAEVEGRANSINAMASDFVWLGWQLAFEQAAQMLEEKLNGDGLK